MNTAIEKTEIQLIDISQKIGSVAEKNSHYTYGLALRLSTLDESIIDISIRSLVNQIDQYTTTFNAKNGGEI